MMSKMTEGEEILDGPAYKEAVHAMESGDEKAKMKVAFYKLTGRGGVEIDVKGAVALLEDSSEKGNGEAKWMLGLCCEYGIGTKQDIERAESLYQQSYDAGNVVGEFFVWNDLGGRGEGVMKADEDGKRNGRYF